MKKKTDLKKLALLGITGGLMIAAQAHADTPVVPDDLEGVFANQFVTEDKCKGDDGCGGFLIAANSCSGAGGCPGMESPGNNGKENGKMTEEELMSQLHSRGRATYNSLDEEGKALARQVAGQKCSGENECKGLNSCKGDDNECAGHGNCKGQGGCEHKDKNDAVDVAAKKMAKKRNNWR